MIRSSFTSLTLNLVGDNTASTNTGNDFIGIAFPILVLLGTSIAANFRNLFLSLVRSVKCLIMYGLELNWPNSLCSASFFRFLSIAIYPNSGSLSLDRNRFTKPALHICTERLLNSFCTVTVANTSLLLFWVTRMNSILHRTGLPIHCSSS